MSDIKPKADEVGEGFHVHAWRPAKLTENPRWDGRTVQKLQTYAHSGWRHVEPSIWAMALKEIQAKLRFAWGDHFPVSPGLRRIRVIEVDTITQEPDDLNFESGDPIFNNQRWLRDVRVGESGQRAKNLDHRRVRRSQLDESNFNAKPKSSFVIGTASGRNEQFVTRWALMNSLIPRGDRLKEVVKDVDVVFWSAATPRSEAFQTRKAAF